MKKVLSSEVQGQENVETHKFSAWEMKIFNTVNDSMSIRDAAQKLGVDEQRLYNFFYNLRAKYYRRYSWCNALNGQRNRSKLLQRVLTDRQHASLKKREQLRKEDKEIRRLRMLAAEDEDEQ